MSQPLYLPEGVHPGVIIGKKGANVKNITAVSGAKVAIDSEKRVVTFRGNFTQVKKARDMVQQQINNYLTQPNTSPYPCFTAMNLSRDFEDSSNIRFKAVRTPEDTKRDRKEQMYRLDLDLVDELASRFAKSSLGGSSTAPNTDIKKRCFYSRKTESNEATTAYLDVATNAVEFKKPGFGGFDVIKLRINFGAQLFYTRSRGPKGVPQNDMSLSEVLGLSIGYDSTMNSSFSNFVLPTTVARVRKLLPQFGFAPSGTSNTIVCHTRDKAKDSKMCFKFGVEDGKAEKLKLKLIKVRTGYAKIALLGFVHPLSAPTELEPGQVVDYRVRLLGEYSVSKEVNDEAAVLTKGATWIEAEKKIESKLNEKYEIELIRHKKKTYYTGKYQDLKIGVALVDVGDDVGAHPEIEVSFRESDVKPTDRAAFDKIIAFCDALRSKIIE